MKFSAVLSTAILAIAMPGTVLAWDHVLNDYGNGQVLNAVTAFDEMGDTSFILGCLMGSGTFHIQLITSAPGVVQSGSEVTITASGVTFPVPVLLGDNGGFLMASASSDTAPTVEVAQALYAASGQVEVIVEGQAYYFEGGAFADSFGGMLDACG
ncbi:hypothetical protein [Devosia sediminis]|uniref:Uncharacterized protein n=1 Tax=Devosia sediminis TaxID=2798801 RepID=A0A934MGX9_9HYPH|nr:hypothetical protein [Devosia sediminis]MBJ3784442.1 hypothetical protein [Devosia sediminis]